MLESNRNPGGTNQHILRSDAELQKIIDSKPKNWTKKDFRGEGKLNSEKLLTRKETDRPDLTFHQKGKRINMENKGEEVQEIISNIIILVQNGFREVSKHEKWNDIFSHISKISSSSKKNFKSLSSKSIFSYLDLIEELED